MGIAATGTGGASWGVASAAAGGGTGTGISSWIVTIVALGGKITIRFPGKI
jgi:hypothetical protein